MDERGKKGWRNGKGDRIGDGEVVGEWWRHMRHETQGDNHRRTKNQISFKKLSSPSYNSPFIVVEEERSGRDDASWCFARAWTVTPVFGKFDESVRAARCIVEWLTGLREVSSSYGELPNFIPTRWAFPLSTISDVIKARRNAKSRALGRCSS